VQQRGRPEPASEVGSAIGATRRVFLFVALFSGIVNILALTGPLYMMQVYDRVLSSRSIPTLVMLSLAALFLYAMQAVLDIVRARILVRLGATLDERLGERVYKAIVSMPLRIRSGVEGLQPMRDLDAIRSFMASQGPIAIFDMPWMPVYLGLVYLLHPSLGLLATAGALVLCGFTWVTDRQTKSAARELAKEASQRIAIAEAGRRNAEVLRAMGLTPQLTKQWLLANDRYLRHQEQLSDIAGGLGSASRIFRLMLQSALLGLGAYLIIHGEASGGVMLAASFIASRALAPIESAIANWKGFVAARQGAKRLDEVLAAFPAGPRPLSLPAPQHRLSVEGVYASAPGTAKPIIQNIAFKLEAGQGLGIIGPSAAGKSTLARALVGVWPVLRGEVRLDGAALDQWSHEALGRHIGYLPQDIELFDGTVGQNIARFHEDAEPEAIIAAARQAGVHEMILRLPDGYDTKVGESGAALSAGQRQRVGLARALYGDPFLVVLDEPNSNLDSEGEAALTGAIGAVRRRGGIVVVIAHRASAVAAVDLLAVINNGQLQTFGPKDEVLKTVIRPQPAESARREPATRQGAPAVPRPGRESAA
jgi:PrtD family type I secretion system ABC transporter